MVAEPATFAPRGRAWVLAQAGCEKCTLAVEGHADKPVVGRGLLSAELVIIGEAPGINEQEQGVPFIGRSGDLLWHSLRARGVSRSQTYATNSIICLPPKGPTATSLRCCAPRLEAELGLLTRKRVVLCVGTSAATAMRGEKSSISEMSGRVEWSERWGCWLAFAYHPAAVLRNPDLYTEFIWAVEQAIQALNLPLEKPADPPPVRYEVGEPDGVSSVLQMLTIAATQPKVVIDLETTGLDPYTIRILEVGLCWDADWAYILPERTINLPEVHDRLDWLVHQPNVRFVYHNGKYDSSVMKIQMGIDARIDTDTMLLHFALDERGGGSGGYHDLKRLSMRYCGAPPYADHIDGAHMEQVPEAERNQYQAYDLVYTYRLDTVLTAALEREAERNPSRYGWPTPKECHDRLAVPAAHMLRNVELRGIRIDYERLKELQADYEKQIAKAKVVCAEAADLNPETFNPNSWQQVLKVLLSLGYPNLGSTDEATLHELQRWDAEQGRETTPFLNATLEYRSLVHTKSTYLDGIETRLLTRGPGDGRLRGSLLQHVAVTGRLAARDPNLQNIPKDSIIREIFVAGEGCTLVEADYRRLEVGILAWLSGDEALTRDFLADDFHWNTAKRVFPEIVAQMDHAREVGSLELLEALLPQYPFFNDFYQRQLRPTERVTSVETLYDMLKTRLRRQAKFISFGVMFGEGAEALANPETGMGVPVNVARTYLNSWKAAYSTAIRFMNKQVRYAEAERWVESASGRRRRFPYPKYLAKHIANEAMNMPIQATASDTCLKAATRLDADPDAARMLQVLLLVHDAILSDVRTARLSEGIARIQEQMEGVIIDPHIKFQVDIKTGDNWANLHDWKGA